MPRPDPNQQADAEARCMSPFPAFRVILTTSWRKPPASYTSRPGVLRPRIGCDHWPHEWAEQKGRTMDAHTKHGASARPRTLSRRAILRPAISAATLAL